MSDYILYGSEHSYFTGKVRSYMRYKGLDYEERLATREVYKELILPFVGAPIVPVVQTDAGELVQDTTEIIDFLEYHHPEPSVYPSGACQQLVALLLEQYGDEWLVIPAMHYRWSVLDRQHDFVMAEFGRMSDPDASREQQIAIGEKISAPFRNSISALGVNETTVEAIETNYLEFLEQLNTHFASYPFLLGSRPSIGDFGLMGPMYAHLGRDPVPKAIMEEKAPAVCAWINRMNQPDGDPGTFLPDDEVPATLLPILETLCEELLPDVLDVIEHNQRFMAEHPGDNIPRYLGMHDFTTGGISSQRYIHSYSQWMFQRSHEHYHGLASEDKQRAEALLRQIGGLDILGRPIQRRVERKQGQLELVEMTRN